MKVDKTSSNSFNMSRGSVAWLARHCARNSMIGVRIALDAKAFLYFTMYEYLTGKNRILTGIYFI